MLKRPIQAMCTVCVCVCVCVCSVMSNSLWSHELQPARLLCPWDFPGKNTGVGCHFLLQGIFLTQIISVSTALQVDSLTLGPPWKPLSPWEGYQNECVHRVVKFTKVKYFNSSQLWLLPVSTAISPHFGWCRMVTSIWGLVLGHWLRMHFVWVSWQTWFSVAFMCEVSADSFKPAKQRVGAILRLSVQFSSVQFSHLVVSESLIPLGLQHTRPPHPSPISSSVISFSCNL